MLVPTFHMEIRGECADIRVFVGSRQEWYNDPRSRERDAETGHLVWQATHHPGSIVVAACLLIPSEALAPASLAPDPAGRPGIAADGPPMLELPRSLDDLGD